MCREPDTVGGGSVDRVHLLARGADGQSVGALAFPGLTPLASRPSGAARSGTRGACARVFMAIIELSPSESWTVCPTSVLLCRCAGPMQRRRAGRGLLTRSVTKVPCASSPGEHERAGIPWVHTGEPGRGPRAEGENMSTQSLGEQTVDLLARLVRLGCVNDLTADSGGEERRRRSAGGVLRGPARVYRAGHPADPDASQLTGRCTAAPGVLAR